MGAWFYMTAVGNFVAGKIGEATGGHDGAMSKQGLLDIYELFGFVAIGVAVVVLVLSPIVKRWMHLDTLQDRDDGLLDIEGGAQAGIEAQESGMHPPARPER
jgi:POT family proton-dependent oligopeptide transporter